MSQGKEKKKFICSKESESRAKFILDVTVPDIKHRDLTRLQGCRASATCSPDVGGPHIFMTYYGCDNVFDFI